VAEEVGVGRVGVTTGGIDRVGRTGGVKLGIAVGIGKLKDPVGNGMRENEKLPVGLGKPPVGLEKDPVGLGKPPLGKEKDPVGLGKPPLGKENDPVGLGKPPLGNEKDPVGLGKEKDPVGLGKENDPVGKPVGRGPVGKGRPVVGMGGRVGIGMLGTEGVAVGRLVDGTLICAAAIPSNPRSAVMVVFMIILADA